MHDYVPSTNTPKPSLHYWQRKILVGVGEPCNPAVPFTSRVCSDFHVGGIAVTRYIFQIPKLSDSPFAKKVDG